MARRSRSSGDSSVSPFGSDLAHENVPGANLCSDADNTFVVEVANRLLADVGNLPGDLLLPPLGVAYLKLEFLDMNRCEHILLSAGALADYDCVFEVVTVPGHEGDQNVHAQSEVTRNQ